MAAIPEPTLWGQLRDLGEEHVQTVAGIADMQASPPRRVYHTRSPREGMERARGGRMAPLGVTFADTPD